MDDWTDLQAANGRVIAGHRLGEPLDERTLRALRLSDRCPARFHLVDLDPALAEELEAGVEATKGTFPVLASGVLDATHGYLITAELRGPTLDDLLERGPVEPRRAEELIRGLIRTYQRLHAAGRLLLDVRPSDVVVEGGLDGQEIRMPPHPALVGPPSGRRLGGYCAPEVAWQEADPRADQFTLGVLAYELLTGATPHNPDAPPGERTLLPLSLPAEIPADLAGVIERLLESEPNGRFADLSEVLEALGPDGGEPGYGHFTPVIPSARQARPALLSSSLPPPPPYEEPEDTEEESIFGFLLLLVGVWAVGTGLSVAILFWW